MTWASRDSNTLLEKAMQQIGKEIDASERDLVWLIFLLNDKTLDPQPKYFPAGRPESASSKQPPLTPTRINVPVPSDVKSEHVRHLVYAVIRDGYDFSGFVHWPGTETLIEA